MDLFTSIHLLRPLWLIALIPACLLFFALLRHNRTSGSWERFISPQLLSALIQSPSGKKSQLPLYLLILSWLIACLALAGPVWEKRSLPVSKSASAMVIVWDLSPSVMTEDIKPSRFVRGRLKLIDLLNQRNEGLTALIVYSGEAHTVTPLTDDTRTIRSLLPGLSPSMLPIRGSNIEMAITTANQLLESANIAQGTILVITDGIDKRAIKPLVATHQSKQHQLAIWGIGTDEGAPIPLDEGGFARDGNGNIVISKLNEALLSDIAVKLKGVYVPFSSSDNDIRLLNDIADKTVKGDMRQSERNFDKWVERGPLIILLLLPMALFAFRRGVLLSVALIIVTAGLVPSTPAHADITTVWDKLWHNQDQRAHKTLQQGDAQTAASEFNDPKWEAVARYKAGEYEAANDVFSEGSSAQDYFNQGNALTHLENYDAAIKTYEQALALQPEFREAANNLEIAKTLKKMSEQEQQQPDSNQGENKEQGSDPEQENSQQQNNSEQGESDSQGESQQQNQADEQQQGQQGNSENAQDKQTDNASEQQEGNDNDKEGETNATEKQQQALEKAYGEQNEKPLEKDSEEKESISTAEKENEQGENQATPTALLDENNVISPEQKEQLQALQQWLRKVPDDPSGLMRNKFEYETRLRRQEMQRGVWQAPGIENEERW